MKMKYMENFIFTALVQEKLNDIVADNQIHFDIVIVIYFI